MPSSGLFDDIMAPWPSSALARGDEGPPPTPHQSPRPVQWAPPSMSRAVGPRVGAFSHHQAQIYVFHLNCGFRHAFLIENLLMPLYSQWSHRGGPSQTPSAWIHAAHLNHGFRHASLIENAQIPLYFQSLRRNVLKVGPQRIEAPLYRNGRKKKTHVKTTVIFI